MKKYYCSISFNDNRQLDSLFFKGMHFSLFIYNYLYINKLYDIIEKRPPPFF